jgi:hypothetical protein
MGPKAGTKRKLEVQPVAGGRRQSHITDFTSAQKAGSTRVRKERVSSPCQRHAS